jgi:hypothetical protein
MVGKNATPLIGWHSADPAMKPRIEAEAAQRGITLRELLDKVLADWFAWLDEADREHARTTETTTGEQQ